MASQSPIVIRVRNLQLNGVKAHGNCEVDPPPHVSASVTALVGPPLTVDGTSIRTVTTGEMLHQETGVDRDNDAGAEPCQETKDLAGIVIVIQAWLL